MKRVPCRFLLAPPGLSLVMVAEAVHKECEDCAGTGWHGDNGPGMPGNSDVERLREALRRIAWGQPDRLDHAEDVRRLEKMTSIARAVLEETP